VEITGPVERKMIINELNSGAQVFVVSMTVTPSLFSESP
jgi:malate synthase